MSAEHFKKPWSLKSTNFGESMGYDSLTVIVDADGLFITGLGTGDIRRRAREERAAREIVDAINAEARKVVAMGRKIAVLRAALNPFAKEAEKWSSLHRDSLVPNLTPSVVEACDRELAAFTVGDLRHARSLLKGSAE